MSLVRGPMRADGDGAGRTWRRRRWVTAIPPERERWLYFLAALVLVGWYLLDRLL